MRTMLTHKVGDATAPSGKGTRVIVHCVNDIGRWGAGFVVAVSKKWPIAEDAYREWARLKHPEFLDRHYNSKVVTSGSFLLGEVQIIEVEPGLYVANLIGQHGIRQGYDTRPPIRYEAISKGLGKVYTWAKDNNASVHMPRMGAGLAGGSWAKIEGVVKTVLCEQGIRVTVYSLL